VAFQKKVTQLEFENANLRRLIFSSKTERFVANAIACNQGSLFAENIEGEEEKEEKLKISLTKKND